MLVASGGVPHWQLRLNVLFSLVQALCDIPVAVIDTETTGVSAAFGHRVVEVGIVRLEGGRAIKQYQQLIDPGRRISPGVTWLTGITQEMVTGQPRFADQLEAMMEMLKGAAILGHNVRFDLSFLSAEFRRAGLNLAELLADVPIFDTVRMARRRFGRGGNSLPILSRRLGVEPTASHRALADAVTTAGVFEKLLEQAGGWATALCSVLEQQGGVIDAGQCAGEPLLPLELEEALEGARPVMMEYVDAQGLRTERMIQPLHVRRHNGELLLVAFCHLRQDRRTFKLDRVVRLTRVQSE